MNIELTTPLDDVTIEGHKANEAPLSEVSAELESYFADSETGPTTPLAVATTSLVKAVGSGNGNYGDNMWTGKKS